MSEPQAQSNTAVWPNRPYHFTSLDLASIACHVKDVTPHQVWTLLQAAERVAAKSQTVSRFDPPRLPLKEHRVATNNHNPFHAYVKLNGQMTDEGVELLRFAREMEVFAYETRQRRCQCHDNPSPFQYCPVHNPSGG